MRNHTIIAFLFALFIHTGIFLLMGWKTQSNEKTQLIIPVSNRAQVSINNFSLSPTKKAIAPSPKKSEDIANKEIAPAEISGANSIVSNTTSETSVKSLSFSTFTPPAYPRFAREKGLEGSVAISASFNEMGAITEVKILKSSGVKAFHQSVLDAAKTWKIQTDHAGHFEKNFEFKLNN